MNATMHDNEPAIDAQLARRLISSQFPAWADRQICPVDSGGTMHALFRLGDEMVIRMPRIPEAAALIHKEHELLPRLAPLLPLALPLPLAKGVPDEGYAWHWSINQWLAGDIAMNSIFIDNHQAALELANFIISMRSISFADQNPAGRGLHLAPRDTHTRKAIQSLHRFYDVKALTAVWDESLHAPAWNEPPVWTHGDLIPTNLLVDKGRLAAVIDYDTAGLADPAWDMLPAWSVFPVDARGVFRDALAVDEATWVRGRGLALSQAVLIIPYYEDTNPILVAVAHRAIKAILEDVFYVIG